ncbi:hypothetical protein [Hasllibacter sp. MH4015]|uniref:hypothetical protein n=1 Tax=Hasllibacter sp. MH4015 TaxID=2854029 RepID=UPI001CD2882E|nr:hypothetical protein [Hasllibacter sp. MH4015]
MSEPISNDERLLAALEAALDRYDERVEVPFSASPSFRVVPNDDFRAHVFPLGDGLGIDVSSGAAVQIIEAWHKALTLSAELPEHRQIQLLGRPEHAADMSLRWLMQHELNHFAIGHFKITGSAGISDAGPPVVFDVASRRTQPCIDIKALPQEEQDMVSPCLELQTDQDATEIVLGAYAAENWPLYRYYATCILPVMFILEREDQQYEERSRTHPMAATRLYQLLAYLTELPYIPAYKLAHHEGLEHIPDAYLPSAEEIDGYREAILEPVFASSQIFAEAVGIPDAWDKLGGAEDFFADIENVLTNGHQPSKAFRTDGAKQWAELKPLNDRLLQMIRDA